MKTKIPTPKIIPREPLSRKARQAITQYAIHKGKNLPITGLMVGYVLQAERMRRADLYTWLEKQGYQWLPKSGLWKKTPK